jgi:molybdate transport system substrate-binding protein
MMMMGWMGCRQSPPASKSLLLYVGAASKPPVEEIVANFIRETGIPTEVVFGGSGYILSQMKLAGRGDIYFPGSSDFMEIAKREQLIYPETEQSVVYLVNAINVARGNPKKIRGMRDLCRPGIRLAIAQPESVCVGTYAVELIEKNLSADERRQLRSNIVSYTESCDKTATVVALQAVDAVIGWEVFAHWNPKQIESIPLPAEEIVRIGYIPIAISTLSQQKQAAQQFIDYVMSPKGKAIFKRYRYFATPTEAAAFIGAEKPVGGEYILPAHWKAQ